MVTRKPVPEAAPSEPNAARPFSMHGVREELWSPSDSDADSERVWGDGASSRHESPRPPNQAQFGDTNAPQVPSALRPGMTGINPFGQDEGNPWDDPKNNMASNHEAANPQTNLGHVPSVLRPGRSETNPFKRKPVSGDTTESNTPAVPQHPPPAPPVDAFAQMDLGQSGQGANPWKPTADEHKVSPAPPTVVPPTPHEPGADIWGSAVPSRQPSASPGAHSPALVSVPSDGPSPSWGDDTLPKSSLAAMPQKSSEEHEFSQDSHAWDDIGRLDNNRGISASANAQNKSSDDWNLIDSDIDPAPPTLSRQSTWENFDDDDEPAQQQPKGKAPAMPEPVPAPSPAPVPAPVPAPALLPEITRAPSPGPPPASVPEPAPVPAPAPASSPAPAPAPVLAPAPVPAPAPASATPPSFAAVAKSGETPPELPPRRSQEIPPPQPPRPGSSAADKTETYQIKNINWYDESAAENPRRSPILVQNANGPCPLVALVNALSMTTPANLTNTVLVETLRSREQISLNLLLEAVFDELMSPRRSKPDVPLPDVSELYAFLKGLHTGMNVNPRYIPTPEHVKAHKRTSLTHVHPSERGDFIPGTFEDTRDMNLYATFSIPLIHGWLPPKNNPVYEAFARQASSYDDVQSLLFREEELEDKLGNDASGGLSEQEQEMYQDIMTIKSFLASSATQLTHYGLEVITQAVKPGSFSILFRNDHFSTLYRHPQTLQLLVLVTDAGYYTHDEIVWESLVDVNGERAEFLSGDFRLVSGVQHQAGEDASGSWYEPAASSATGGGEWQTVPNRRGHSRNSTAGSSSMARSPNHEQEDRDLALALQLQEEEEERHRNEQAARRRETQLSQNFIDQQGRGGPNSRGSTRGRVASNGGTQTAGRGGPSAPVAIPARGNSNPARGARPVQQVRPLVPPATNATHRPTDALEDDAPPSYEQASKATPYVPPAGHPSHPESSLGSNSGRRRPTAGSPRASGNVAGPSGAAGRARPPQPVAANASADDRHRDCAMM